MKYSIKWYVRAVEVTFNGYIIMQDIDDAKYAVNSDKRYERCIRSVWDFRGCNTEMINVDDLYSAVAIDVGSSMLPPLDSHKLVLIADDLHTIKLCEFYIDEMEEHTNWSLELFCSLEGEILPEGCNAKHLPADELAMALKEYRCSDEVSTEVGLSQRTLLLVDSDANIHIALMRILRSEGYNILSASKPSEALELLTQHSIGVIMCDHYLPGISGVDFLGQVKILYPETVRILLSGYTHLESLAGAVNRGSVSYFMTKPWDDGRLRQMLRDAFNQFLTNSNNCQADMA